jgi:hypothetical protein
MWCEAECDITTLSRHEHELDFQVFVGQMLAVVVILARIWNLLNFEMVESRNRDLPDSGLVVEFVKH